MQIIIDQNEITEAIETFVRQQITIADDQEVSVDLKAGRGDNGFSATIEIRQAAKAKHKPVQRRAATQPALATPAAPTPVAEEATEAQEPRMTNGDDLPNAEPETAPEPVKATVTLTPAVKTGSIFGNPVAEPAAEAAPASAEEPAAEAVAAQATTPAKKSIFNFGQANQPVAAE